MSLKDTVSDGLLPGFLRRYVCRFDRAAVNQIHTLVDEFNHLSSSKRFWVILFYLNANASEYFPGISPAIR